MEQILDSLYILNKSLINKKNKIKNKLYEKIINSNYYLELESEEDSLFKKASEFFKYEEYEEYEKLRLRYEKLKSITISINNFIKEY